MTTYKLSNALRQLNLSASPRCLTLQCRYNSSSSSKRWLNRQGNDHYSKKAKTQGLKSRAAFKLFDIHNEHKIFSAGDTVVDLGYAPGSWSQVAVNFVQPHGRVVGLDVLSANPPKGVSTLQGNFLSPSVQQMLINFLRDRDRGRPKTAEKITEVPSYVDMERYKEATPTTPAATPVAVPKGTTEATEATNTEAASTEGVEQTPNAPNAPNAPKAETTAEKKAAQAAKEKEEKNLAKAEERKNKCVDVVLSDMSEPWFPDAGPSQKSLTNPYLRLMNTSGIAFKDHAGSMDLCHAALSFCLEVLRPNGHFVCKFYAGAEDKALELKLKKMFHKVYRMKPESSRKESKENFFVALKLKPGITAEKLEDAQRVQTYVI